MYTLKSRLRRLPSDETKKTKRLQAMGVKLYRLNKMSAPRSRALIKEVLTVSAVAAEVPVQAEALVLLSEEVSVWVSVLMSAEGMV